MKERRYTIGHDLALVGYLEYRHIIRQCFRKLVKFCFNLLTHLHDVFALFHLYT